MHAFHKTNSDIYAFLKNNNVFFNNEWALLEKYDTILRMMLLLKKSKDFVKNRLTILLNFYSFLGNACSSWKIGTDS